MKKSDYLLVLTPSVSIVNRVRKHKQDCKKVIGHFDGVNAKAHITVANYFNRHHFQVEPLIPHLQKSITSLPPVKIKITGYDYFETANGSKKTIYARLALTPNVAEWFERLNDRIKGSITIPHITIIKDIPTEKFDRIWNMFNNKEWLTSFQVDHLTILKRDTFDLDSHYITLKKINFGNSRLPTAFLYKNRSRRVGPRTSILGIQSSMFSDDV